MSENVRQFVILEFIYDVIYSAYYHLFIRSKLVIHLNQCSRYYRTLESGQFKREFEREVWDFITANNFVARGNLEINLRLKVLISAHAVQLSFFLPDECYDYYEKIILYKDYYHSRITGQLHKGEVNPAMRLIVFSVRAIHEGLNREDDGLNILLHEFAHALWLEHLLKGREYLIFQEKPFEAVRSYIADNLLQRKEDDTGFLRKYAYANESEFFAVVVENFFERPEQLQGQLPELYRKIAALLRQDTLKPLR
jgi:MtfA peptidase